MEQVQNVSNSRRMGTSTTSGNGNGRGATMAYANYAPRNQTLYELRKKLYSILASRGKTFASVDSYSDLYNSWRNSVPEATEKLSTTSAGDNSGRRYYKIFRTTTIPTANGPIILKGNGQGFSSKIIDEGIYHEMLLQMLEVHVQSDSTPSKESVQGDATQSSEQQSNTIITRDQGITVARPIGSETLSAYASSEKVFAFSDLVERWTPLNRIKVSTGDARGKILVSYNLPETFLDTMAKCAPNTIPFETFVYGAYDYEFRFLSNADKYQVGKIIVAVKFDSYQADDIQNSFQAMLGRPHIQLDLSANNQATLAVPFRYHRAFVRNLTHSTASVGVRPGKFATVDVAVLSPLKTGTGGLQTMDIRPMYRITRAEFAGMSYKVPLTQMDPGTIIASAATEITSSALKSLIDKVEKCFDQIGTSRNQDKPSDNRATIIIPRPRLHFPSGKGISDASQMRVNPVALTSYGAVKAYADEPRTTFDIARIWGLRSTFDWDRNTTEGKELFNSIIDPTCRSYTADYTGNLTPLEYMASIYNFWSGTIELRFDFASNQHHTGSVVISAEYNRTSTTTDECQSHSTYTKTFELGAQKSCAFVVPYIYDTVWRRSTGAVYRAVTNSVATSDTIKSSALSIRPESRMRVKVRVLNALRPVSIAPPVIEVLCYMRAGPNFRFHSLKAADHIDNRDIVPIDSFPSDNYNPTNPENNETSSTTSTTTSGRRRRDATEPEAPEAAVSTSAVEPTKYYGITYVATYEDRYLPKEIANKWNEKKPAYQMDTGEKENEDSTINFSGGLSALEVQTTDAQMDIKDILRRPVLLFHNQKYNANSTGYFIPLMPPSRMLQFAEKEGKTTDFVKTVGSTPAAWIMNLFRFWRGSMRYTIVVRPTTNQAPIYVTFVPHTGTRLFSNKVINQVTADVKNPIYGSGLTVEMIIPQVNPTASIEAPYDTENTWTLTFDEDALRNYSWRDKGDLTSGHLVLSSTDSFTFDCWWAAGDDFEFANFYGVPEVKSNSWAYQHSDEHARVQMEDFRPANVLTSVNTFCKDIKKVFSAKNAINTAICAVPVVGPAYGLATVVGTVNDVGTRVNTLVDNTQSNIDRVVNCMGITISGLVELVTNSVNKVTKGLSLTANLTSYCFDVILDILVAWIDKSWAAIGMGIVRFIGKALSAATISKILHYGVQLGDILAHVTQPREPEVQMPRDPTTTFIGVIAGIVGTIVGIKINMYRYTSLFHGILSRLTDAGGMSYLVNVLRFVESTFSVIKESILHHLGYVTPEAAALKMLSNSSAVLQAFVADAQLVTSEVNSSVHIHPSFRNRMWKTVMQAYQIQALLAVTPSGSASPVLSKLCCEVIKAGNDKFVDISACPVRYEPFVICFEGQPGIGKSELLEDLAQYLLDRIGYQRPHSGLMYYHMANSRYCNTYKDQPCWGYDEFLNMADIESCINQLNQFFQIKSTSTFVPEMASLEDKKIRANPLIVFIATNEAFPDRIVEQCVLSVEAVYRRREIVLRTQKKQEFLGIHPRDMSRDDQINFNHLEFAKYRNSCDRNSLSPKLNDYMTTRTYLGDRFVRWHAQESIKVARRLERAYSGMTNVNVNEIRLEDPFRLFYNVNIHTAEDQTTSQNGFLPSEVLALEVNRIANSIQHYQQNPPEIVVPEVPVDIFEAHTQGPLNAVITGLISSRDFLNGIVNWSADMLERWLLKYQVIHEVHECNICMEEKPVYAKCSNSVETNRHVVCIDCYGRQFNLAHHLRCPQCNSSESSLEPIPNTEYINSVGVFATFVQKAAITGKALMRWLSRLFGSDMYRTFTLLHKYMVYFVSYYKGFIDNATDLALAEVINNISGNDAYVSPLRFQIDTDDEYESATEEESNEDNPVADWDDEEPPAPEEEVVDPFRCVVSEERIEEMIAKATVQPVCMHNHLLDEGYCMVYIEGNFRVTLESRQYLVPEYPCANHEHCRFKSKEYQIQVYNEYLFQQRHGIEGRLRSFYNVGIARPEEQLYYIHRVPVVLRPEWMKINDPLYREIDILSSPTWWDYLSEKYEEYKTIIYSIAGLSVAIGGIMTISQLFTTTSPMVQYIDSGDNRTQHVRKAVRSLQRVKPSRAHFQGNTSGETPLLQDVIRSNIARNYITITISGKDRPKLLTACGMFNRIAILPRHYVKELRKQANEKQTIMVGPALLPHETKEYTFDEVDFICSETTDIAMWTLPPSFGMFKDIRKYLCQDNDLEKPINSDGELLLAPGSRNPNLRSIPLEIRGVAHSETIRDADGERFTAYDVLCYDYSQPGACGSLVLLERTNRPIVSMHFAGIGEGKAGEGFGVILTKESIGDILNDNVKATQMEEYHGDDFEDAKVVIPDCNVTYVGVVPPEAAVFLPRKSKIKPSLIQNTNGLSPLTEPCILDKTDSRYHHEESPLIAGVKKHGKLTRDFKSSTVNRAKERLWDRFLSKMKPAVAQPKRLTPEEAVSGFDVEYYDSMVLSTSAGYPWCTTPLKRKDDYIKVERNELNKITNVEISEEIMTVLYRKEKLRREGIIPLTPFVDTLKDERKKKEKVTKLGATRIFCNPPVDYVIAMRQNFMHFTSAFMKQRFSLQHAVGINVNGTEWTQLARRLCEKSPNNICTIDYSNFGPGFNAGVAQAAMELMVRWCVENVDNVDERELNILLEECLNSLHLVTNTLYKQKCGSPSGAPITVVINSLVNELLILIAFEHLCKDKYVQLDIALMDGYKKDVALFVYGDDLIMSVTDEIKELFNACTITKFFKDYDIVATDATKSAEVIPYTPIDKATFLKMGFAKHERYEHIWQSQLDWTSINDTTQWIWECADRKEATYENAKAAILSAHGHGKVKYEAFKNQVNKALRKKGCETIALQWEEVDDLFYPDCIY